VEAVLIILEVEKMIMHIFTVIFQAPSRSVSASSRITGLELWECDRQRRVTTAVHCDRRRSERAFQNKSTWARATNWCFFNYGLKTHFYSLQLFLLHYRHINTIL